MEEELEPSQPPAIPPIPVASGDVPLMVPLLNELMIRDSFEIFPAIPPMRLAVHVTFP